MLRTGDFTQGGITSTLLRFTPLRFLAVSVVLNVALDVYFILSLGWGVEGAAAATVIAQGVAGLGIMLFTYKKRPELRWHREDRHFDRSCLKEIASFSTLTCIQQSVMNLGILVVSALVFVFAEPLMLIFIRPSETEILAIGVEYLRIEGAFYCGIGILFLLYGYYRAIRKPGMSLVLTLLSLGTRVILSYGLASVPSIGIKGIWWSIPIGWLVADVVGICYDSFHFRTKSMRRLKK